MLFSFSRAFYKTIPAHKGGVVCLKEPAGMPPVEIFPLDDNDDGYCEYGPGPERRDKNERRERHGVTPVVYPARTAALSFCKQLKRTDNAHAELVHKDEKNYGEHKPHTVENAGIIKETDEQDGKQPVYGRPQCPRIHAMDILRQFLLKLRRFCRIMS